MSLVFKVTNRSLNKVFKSCLSSGKMQCSSELSIGSYNSGEFSTNQDSLKNIQTFIPKLSSNLHKGQCGRIGIIGGSVEYTGAPYFAGISALKLGADLVHVFCCKEAGPPIKSYSPELMVHTFLDSKDVVNQIKPWLEKLHVLVIGPGLGKDADLLNNVGRIIAHCKINMVHPLPLVIDADGLYLVIENLNLFKDYKGPVILTPNVVEFKRLSVKMNESDPLKIAASLNVVLLQKGCRDVITNGLHHHQFNIPAKELTIVCDVPGSNRRCGGQGDVLSGCIATFVAWLQIHFVNNSLSDFSSSIKNTGNQEESIQFFKNTYWQFSWAVYGGCVITRTCSRLAYEEKGRGMTTSDMILCIHRAFKIHFGI